MDDNQQPAPDAPMQDKSIPQSETIQPSTPAPNISLRDEPISPSETTQSSTFESQAETDQQPTPTPHPKRKRAWPMSLAWVAYAIAVIIFAILGPGILISGLSLGQFGWIMTYFIGSIYVISQYVMLIPLILLIISLIFTYVKFPWTLRTVTILAAGVIFGATFDCLAFGSIIPVNYYILTAVISIIALAPGIVIIILKMIDKKHKKDVNSVTNNDSGINIARETITGSITSEGSPKRSRTRTIVFIVALVLCVAELISTICMLVEPTIAIVQNIQFYHQAQQMMEQAAISSGAESSNELSEMVYVLCSGDYTLVSQGSEETGLFLCNETQEVYSVTNPKAEDTGYMKTASAAYLGRIEDDVAGRIFGDEYYIVRNFQLADMYEDIILLVQGDSEEEVLDEYAGKLYDYYLEMNSEYSTNLRIFVFYNDSLDTVENIEDYIVLNGVAGLAGWLPHGNGFGDYYFQADYAPRLQELAENPDLYSPDTRTAIKFKPHIEVELDGFSDDDEPLGFDEFYEVLAGGWTDYVMPEE